MPNTTRIISYVSRVSLVVVEFSVCGKSRSLFTIRDLQDEIEKVKQVEAYKLAVGFRF